MNSILANIFLIVQERIHAKVPEIRWIDQDWGQLEFYQGKPPVSFPCVLLDFVDADYSDTGENIQLCEFILEVRLAVTAYTQASHVLSQHHKELALEFYNLEHRINNALHGWCDSQYFTPLSRKKAVTERREDTLRVRPLRYAAGFTDFTAVAVSVSNVARPELELKLTDVPN